MIRTLVIALAVLAWSAAAWADPTTAEDWYKLGTDKATLGEYDAAADAFKKGFELESKDANKPSYIFNIAQAYKQGKRCEEAVFFYKRFFEMKDSGVGKPLPAERRDEIAKDLADAEACAKGPDARKPPGEAATPPPKPVVVEHKPAPKVVAQAPPEESDDVLIARTMPAPKRVSARFTAGATKIDAGTTSVPLETAFALVGGYPIAITNRFVFEPGAAVTFTAIPYKNLLMASEQDTSSFARVLANAGATYAVAPRIALHGDLGFGVLWFGGLGAGNPFTVGAASTSGPLPMFALRVAASGEYAINPNLVAVITPLAFAYSPSKDGLRTDIKSISSLDFSIGIGYRM